MAVVITIAGSTRTSDVKLESSGIEQVLDDQQDDYNFTVMSGAKPVEGQAIVVTNGGTKIFGGIISSTKEIQQKPGLVWYACEAVDYMYQFDKELVVEEYGGVNLFPSDMAQVFSAPWTSGTLNGTYTLYIDGSSGSLTLTGGYEYEITAGDSIVFEVSSATVTFTPSGDPEKCFLIQNVSVTEIATDIIARYCTGFTSTGVELNGPPVEYIPFDYMRPSECFKKLADYCGWHWYIDYDKDVKFFSEYTEAAPYEITDASDVFDLAYSLDIQGLRNRVYVKGGTYLSDAYTHDVLADGTSSAWVLPHAPHNLTMTVDGVTVLVGVENEDEETDFDYMVNQKEASVRCASGTSTPAASAELAFTYQYEMPVIGYKDDPVSQAAVAAVQGGDGIYEHVITDDSLTTLDAAYAVAVEDIASHANPVVKGSFKTYSLAGWAPGQLLSIDSTARGIDNTFLIQRVSIKFDSTDVILYTVDFGGRLMGLENFLKSVVSAQQQRKTSSTSVMSKFESMTDDIDVTDALSNTLRSGALTLGSVYAICGFTNCDA